MATVRIPSKVAKQTKKADQLYIAGIEITMWLVVSDQKSIKHMDFCSDASRLFFFYRANYFQSGNPKVLTFPMHMLITCK